VFPFTFVKAADERSALDAGHKGARYIAGGTTLVDLMRETVERPDAVVDINALPYRDVALDGGTLRIGSLVRMSELAADARVRREFPVIAQALELSASAQLRAALQMALRRRHPPRGLLHHSDQGIQYASADYQAILVAHHVVPSMSRRGDCWDNAVAESFFGTLKRELVYGHDFATRAEARAAIFEYVEVFYNGQRRHSALGYLSPVAFERQHARDEQAA
jgi:transposase InsO family protein